MNEFDIIKKYFYRPVEGLVKTGIGDDAAILEIPQQQNLVVTTDTLISDVHFLANTSAFDIGYKSLAVNLSDLAAMGATPKWVTLALTMPHADETWLTQFSQGFFELANYHQVQLIGGDMTHGPLSITVQAFGLIPHQQALLRSKAKVHDLIYVSGTVGDAGLALAYLKKKKSASSFLSSRLNRPEPRVELGKNLLSFAHAAIDISDGLYTDLKHILDESKVGANLYVEKIPLSPEVKTTLTKDAAITLALTSGDDYELCFTIPADKKNLLENLNLPCTCIGEIIEARELNLFYSNGKKYLSLIHI